MKFRLFPTLEHRALSSIASSLWVQQDAISYLSNLEEEIICQTQREWRMLNRRIIKRANRLPLPPALKKKVSVFVSLVGWQILNWKLDHEKVICKCCVESNLGKLCFTSQGTVDKRQTAYVLIKEGNLSVYERYKLACFYCLEQDIYTLRDQLGATFFELSHGCMKLSEPPLVSFWTHFLAGKLSKIESDMRKHRFRNEMTHRSSGEFNPFEYAFELSAFSGNLAATSYFLNKLSPKMRESVLVRAVQHIMRKSYFEVAVHVTEIMINYNEVLCFLLSWMNQDQLYEVYEDKPNRLLESFLDWPWQDLFVDLTHEMLYFLSGEQCKNVLVKIVNQHDYRDQNYQEIFKIFWQQVPTPYKSDIVTNKHAGLLRPLFRTEDEDIIKLYLKAANANERERIIFSMDGTTICEDLFEKENWPLLKLFISECISTELAVAELKKKLLYGPWSLKQSREIWKDCLQYLSFIESGIEARNGRDRDSKRRCFGIKLEPVFT